MTNTRQAWFNTTLTSFGYLNPQNGTDTLLVHRETEQHTWVTLKLLTSQHDQVAKLTPLPFFLVILYPCFLIYFSEAQPLTPPRCVSVSSMENVVRTCQEWRRGWKRTTERRKDKRESVIMTSVCCALHLKEYAIWHTFLSTAVGDDTVWQWFNSSTVKKCTIAIHPSLVLCFLTPTLMFPVLPMVAFKHTIFHLESRYRNAWWALCHGAQAITDRHTMLP